MFGIAKTKDLQETNLAIKAFMKVVQCLMWCLEKVVKYVTRNAYIMVAMRGASFCSATFRAFRLIFANLAQVYNAVYISNVSMRYFFLSL